MSDNTPARRRLCEGPFQLGFGTYQLGDTTQEMCLRALELGYRHIDTANLYRNEAAVAAAIEESGIPRSEIFVTTKIHVRDIVLGQVADAAQRALDIFGQIDLLLLHAPTPNAVQAWSALREVNAPAIREIGVSNFNITFLEALAPHLPAYNQIEITPFWPRRDLADYCRRRHIGVIAHSSLTKARRLNHPMLIRVGLEHDATPAQVLLAWGLAKGFAVLPRTSNPAHLEENFQAGNLVLSTEDLALLEQVEDGFATHPSRP